MTKISSPQAGGCNWIAVDDERKPPPGKAVIFWVHAARQDEDDQGRPIVHDVSGIHTGEWRVSEHGNYFDCHSTPCADVESVTHWMDPSAPGAAAAAPSQAERDVLAERRRQIEEEFYTAEHDDDEHERGELAAAAASYAVAAAGGDYTADNPPVMWPADWDFKPGKPRRMMVKACALLLAEIERRDRTTQQGASHV